MSRTQAALLVFVALGALGGTWKTMLSPGPLAPAHSAQSGDCDACHLSFAGIPDSKCLACHDDMKRRLDTNRGYHATVRDQECIACHGDHGGTDEALTKAPARQGFDHERTGFSLQGAHGKQTCDDCHKGPIGQMQGVCSSCHDDAHQSSLGPACDTCHVASGWSQGLKTLSAHLLDMTAKHGQQECNDCHLHGENLTGDIPCANCHQDTHGGTITACDQCHQVTAFKPASFDHGPCTCAFPGKHQTVECLACHENFNFANTPIVCSGCHDDERPHDPIGECSACHTATSWVDNRFDHNKQAKFKIEGAHEAVSCVQCHAEGNFRGAPRDCQACHQARGDEAHGDFGACARCHVVKGFAPSTFDHATTGFSLAGRHTELGCQACHDGKVEGYVAP